MMVGGGGELLNVLGFLHYVHINPHSLSKLELIDSGEAPLDVVMTERVKKALYFTRIWMREQSERFPLTWG